MNEPSASSSRVDVPVLRWAVAAGLEDIGMTNVVSARSRDCLRVDGGRLRELRLDHGWTQRDLARRAGVSERTVRTAEYGGPVSPATLGFLARALGTHPSRLRARV